MSSSLCRVFPDRMHERKTDVAGACLSGNFRRKSLVSDSVGCPAVMPDDIPLSLIARVTFIARVRDGCCGSAAGPTTRTE